MIHHSYKYASKIQKHTQTGLSECNVHQRNTGYRITVQPKSSFKLFNLDFLSWRLLLLPHSFLSTSLPLPSDDIISSKRDKFKYTLIQVANVLVVARNNIEQHTLLRSASLSFVMILSSIYKSLEKYIIYLNQFQRSQA